MDWFPWYPALYRADTLDLTLEQDGAYRRLIDHYMETRLPLPDNNNALARIIGISINDFEAIAEQVRCKFNAKGDSLHSKRCDIELNRQDSLSRKRSNVAKAAHDKRNNGKDLQASAKQKPSNSSDTGQDRTGHNKEKNNDLFSNFPEFWSLCTKKVGKANAEKAYLKALKTVSHETIIKGFKVALRSWEGTDRQYIPNPATWLNGGGWDDEYSADAESGQLEKTPEFVGTHPDSERNVWIHRIKMFRKNGSWLGQYGPNPDEPDCEAPKDLLK